MTAAARKYLLLGTCCAIVALMCLLLAQSKRHRQSMTCTGLKVEYADDHRFVTDEDVKGYLDKYYGGYIGQQIDSVKLSMIEEIIDNQSAILKSEAYVTDDGMLNIRISQREPCLRFQKDMIGFYVDSRGYIFPLQDKFTAKVPVIDGDIPVSYSPGYKGKAMTEEEGKWIEGVIGLMNFIDRSKMWRESMIQFSVRKNGDLVLVPRTGRELFIFGKPDNCEEKFGRIAQYYQYIKPAREDGFYRTVNVKYEGQIICRK